MQAEVPVIYVSSKQSRRRNALHPRCENLQCQERSGGTGPGSRGVVCHHPIFNWVGKVAEPKTGSLTDLDIVLCCFCVERYVDADGGFSVYFVDGSKR